MNKVFPDTHYFIAKANPDDQWREPSIEAEKKLGQFSDITTDAVLLGFLNSLSKYGLHIRNIAIQMVKEFLINANVKVVPQGRDLFLKGLKFYEDRQDKEFSLTDCISMVVMKSEGLSQALTNDHHFEQAGFEILIKK